ncbi:MAG: hypothetical protein VKP57_09675 [Candidatus Sericytochromatia bacterium]|nr:hypothetical protein [Candidatus Sericytochromatia bacterium]
MFLKTSRPKRLALTTAATMTLAGCSPATLNNLLAPPATNAPAASAPASGTSAAGTANPLSAGFLSVALLGQALPSGAKDIVIIVKTGTGDQTRTVPVAAMGGDASSQVFEGLAEGPVKVRAEIRDAGGRLLGVAETDGIIKAGERLPLQLRFLLGPGSLDLRMAPLDSPDVRAVQKLLDDFEGYIYDHMGVVDLVRNPDLLRCMKAFNDLSPVLNGMLQNGASPTFGKNKAGYVDRMTLTANGPGPTQTIALELEQQSLSANTRAFVIRVPQAPNGASAEARLEVRASAWQTPMAMELGEGYRLLPMAMPDWSKIEAIKAHLEVTPDALTANRVILEAEGDGPAVNADLTFLDDLFTSGYATRQRCYQDWAGPDYDQLVENCYPETDYNRPIRVRFGDSNSVPVAIPRMIRLSAAIPGGAAGQFSARLEPAERRMVWNGSLAGLDYDGSLTFRSGESSGRTTTIGARLAARMVDAKMGIEFPITGDITFHPPDAPGIYGNGGDGLMDRAPGYALPFGRLSVMGLGIDRPGVAYLSQPRIRHAQLGDIAEMYYSTTGMMLKLTGHEVRAVSYMNPLERVLRHNSDALGWMNPLDGIKYPVQAPTYTQPINRATPWPTGPGETPDPYGSYPPYEPTPGLTPDSYGSYPPPTPSPLPFSTPVPPYYGESPSPAPYASYPPYYGESPSPDPYASYPPYYGDPTPVPTP